MKEVSALAGCHRRAGEETMSDTTPAQLKSPTGNGSERNSLRRLARRLRDVALELEEARRKTPVGKQRDELEKISGRMWDAKLSLECMVEESPNDLKISDT